MVSGAQRYSHSNHMLTPVQPTPADIRRRNAQFEHKNKTGTGKAAKPVRENSSTSLWLVAFFVLLLGGGRE
ncbi:hypothetical protein E3P77_01181 [Wallemia ichthyophaga]|nr:hypothetical protein E3P96_01619 [Wallemia ichthyophaga]TIB68265.1 hypothetical protein E3P77_01181 [Wallemia ichthyophaga]